MIYLDHAATTQIYPDVIEILKENLSNEFANPSSSHLLGRNQLLKLYQLRQEFIKILGGAENDHFIFTSSATESNNTVIKGICFKKDDIILYSKGDHKSITEPIEFKKDNCSFNIANLDEAHKVKLIVVSFVNNQSGQFIDLEKTCSEYRLNYPLAHIHVDAVQGFGKIPLKIPNSVNSLSITSHKIGGPKGIAGLYLKKGHKVAPLLLGGGQQENMRSSTESYPLAYAFFQATKKSILNLEPNLTRAIEYNIKVKNFIKTLLPMAIFPFSETSPYILCFIIPKISSDVLIRHLESREVYIASTSACSSRIKGHNSTMEALGIDSKYHKNVLRISFGYTTTHEELNSFCDVFHAVWNDIAYLVK